MASYVSANPRRPSKTLKTRRQENEINRLPVDDVTGTKINFVFVSLCLVLHSKAPHITVYDVYIVGAPQNISIAKRIWLGTLPSLLKNLDRTTAVRWWYILWYRFGKGMYIGWV